jgi:hypothetical protein
MKKHLVAMALAVFVAAGNAAHGARWARGARAAETACPGPHSDGKTGQQSDAAQSRDPNEMGGPAGAGDARYVKAGEWLDYTIYFENQTNATAAAQEIRVTLGKDPALDWDTFEAGTVAFGEHIDAGLSGKGEGKSSYRAVGLDGEVRTTVSASDETVSWYLRSWEPRTADHFPEDFYAGILPPNDESGRGEGYLRYRVRVREDAVPGTVIRASASIVFDENPAIETDPAWWNTVATVKGVTLVLGADEVVEVEAIVGAPWGDALPVPEGRGASRFAGWWTGAEGTGTEVTSETMVTSGMTRLYARWDSSALDEMWLDVSWGDVAVGATGVEEGYGLDGEAVEGVAERYVLTGTSTVYGVKFAKGSFTNTWTNLVVDLEEKDAVAVALEGAQVEVTLEGDNFVGSGEDCAGIRVDTNSVLTLQGTGRLEAYGGKCGAGIGGGKLQESGRVEIHAGTVEAYGGEYGAGIGGGLVAPAAVAVVITGGSVKARGSDGGEDIGGGFGREGTGVPVDGERAEVHEVEVPLATDELPVEVVVEWGDGRTYRYEGMGHGEDSSLWFWLPDGTYDFEADGEDYGVHVAGASAVAVFTDPGSGNFQPPAVEEVSVTETGWRVGLNPAYRTTPFDLWTATKLDGTAWAWEKVEPGLYRFNAETGAVEWLGETKGVRVFRFGFRPKE